MPALERLRKALEAIPRLSVTPDASLAPRIRFGVGGPADLYIETPCEPSLIRALEILDREGLRWAVIGGGTNLIVADEGFRGAVLRFLGCGIELLDQRIIAEAGAELETLVDFANAAGLAGLETLAGIPGTVGGAVYGNAGAYGRSIGECVHAVRIWDGREVRRLEAAECAFDYRESIFKQRPGWVILSAELRLVAGEAEQLRRRSAEIVSLRAQKYPADMHCAGSIFKNLLYDRLPESARNAVPPELVREGKAPAAWFLEQVGAKGLRRGGMQVAHHHANLIYNAGGGTARELMELIAELKRRVRERFGIELEEEVRYLG